MKTQKLKTKFYINFAEVPAEIYEKNKEILKKCNGNSVEIPFGISRECFHEILSRGYKNFFFRIDIFTIYVVVIRQFFILLSFIIIDVCE